MKTLLKHTFCRFGIHLRQGILRLRFMQPSDYCCKDCGKEWTE